MTTATTITAKQVLDLFLGEHRDVKKMFRRHPETSDWFTREGYSFQLAGDETYLGRTVNGNFSVTGPESGKHATDKLLHAELINLVDSEERAT